MNRILLGAETEYGLFVEGRSPEDQVEDAKALVRSYPGECFLGWDYRDETPRSDLRGFEVGQLSVDPNDQKFEREDASSWDSESRADRVLPNGARLYNDHGHPEYATPECWSVGELVRHDLAGEWAVQRAARAFEAQTERRVRLYKNNTDYHGASYGAHENYLAPRSLAFEELYAAVSPILVARTVLCGAGKVGSESGKASDYQLSQRADFLTTSCSVDTLYRRPVFNTRDEPHADPTHWIRLHVIAGDANLSPAAIAARFGLVKLALMLAAVGRAPKFSISDLPRALNGVSRDATHRFEIPLESGRTTSAYEVLLGYFAAFEQAATAGEEFCDEDANEMLALIPTWKKDLESLQECFERFAARSDWAAKKLLLDQVATDLPGGWKSRDLQSYDLEFHNIDPDEGLYFALLEMGAVDPRPAPAELEERLTRVLEPTRAAVRSALVRNHKANLVSVNWQRVALRHEGGIVELELAPERVYPQELDGLSDVGTLVAQLSEES